MDEITNKRLGDLIIELSKGNKEALSEIYSIICQMLYVIGNTYYNCREDIEDSIQDLLLALFYRAKKFKNNINAKAWVITIYHNLNRNRLRRKKREDKFLNTEIEQIKAKSDTSDTEYFETHIFIKEIFNKLTEYERNLLIYAYWCKCSINEVAKILKKPKSTIESQLKSLKDKIIKIK